MYKLSGHRLVASILNCLIVDGTSERLPDQRTDCPGGRRKSTHSLPSIGQTWLHGTPALSGSISGLSGKLPGKPSPTGKFSECAGAVFLTAM